MSRAPWTKLRVAVLFARCALAAAFFSAVADRLGLWGPPGATQVGWGNWQNFVAYTRVLTWYLPVVLVPAAALVATVLEVIAACWLLSGWRLRWAGVLSGALLTLFAVSMVGGLGVKAPLDYSVFSAAAAAFLLAGLAEEKRGSEAKTTRG